MSLELLAKRLCENTSPERVLINEPMCKHTTFRIGGPADLFFMPESSRELALALGLARHLEIPTLVMGNGSNLVVRDGGVRGLVVQLGDRFSEVRVEGARIFAKAGASLSRVAQAAQEAGLTGLEFASGIPGTLGGGTAMNAGAYGGQLSDVLVDADVLIDGEVRSLTRDALKMGYRTTSVLRHRHIITAARFLLTHDDPQNILSRMQDLNRRRREKQPLNFPSAGSFFKRPEGQFAGKLIEEAGLKGLRVGDAQVSEKHAGFLINLGNATARDVLSLMEEVQKRVEEKFQVRLEPEVRIVGVE